MHVPSYGENTWLKHAEIEINFNLAFKGLTKRFKRHILTHIQVQKGCTYSLDGTTGLDYWTGLTLT